MPATPDEMAATMIANLPEKTGRSLEQWLRITEKAGLEKHGQIVKLLKSEHGVTHGFANLIAQKTLESQAGGAAAEGDLVAAQYSGAKSDLRPVYEAVVAAAKKLGKDVEVSPKKTYVSLRRSKQFAIVKPATKTRIDLGLNIKGEKAKGRLEPAGSMGMVTHKVRLEANKDVDADVKRWLKLAYESA